MKTKLSFWALIASFFSLSLTLAILIFPSHRGERALAQSIQDEASPALILTDTSVIPSDLDQEFSLNLNSGQEFNLYVYLYPQNQPLVAADVEINFDPQTLEILEKKESGLFPTYVEPVEGGYLDQVSGTIRLGGVCFDLQTEQPTEPVSTSGEFAHFRAKVKETINSPQVTQIRFIPQTLDPQNNLTTDTNLVSLGGMEEEPEDILGKINTLKLIINQPGDINGDSQVNISDFYLVSRNYDQTENYELRADINRDGQVNIFDFYFISWNYSRNY